MENKISTEESLGFSMAIEMSRDVEMVQLSDDERIFSEFYTNYHYWNSMSNFKSSNNYDDVNFQQIVRMGEAAIPGILSIIQKRPDPIVHALDLILPDYVEYEGFVSLEEVCKIWVLTLLALGHH